MNTCKQTKCADELNTYKKQTLNMMKKMDKLDNLQNRGKLSRVQHEQQMSKIGTSTIERKGMRNYLQCGLEKCFSEQEKAIKNMITIMEQICKKQGNIDGCQKLRNMKASIKNGMLSVSDYAWLHKFVYKIELKI